MSRFLGTQNFTHGRPTKIGVLLCNLGTPEQPTASAVRRYLAEFLSDPRVVEIPPLLWQVILHGIILRVRPRRSAEAYAKVWRDDGSPLLAITLQQAAAIRREFDEQLPERIAVAVGMRYGNPSIASALHELRAANVRKILVVPLYPQYAAATTASVFDAVTAELRRWRWVPALRMIDEYHQDPGYIHALADSLDDHWRAHGRAEHLLMSFHGTPQRSLLAGDPYHCQVHATARLLAEHRALGRDDFSVCFQSRFGRAQWLQPYTEQTLQALAGRGIKTVDVICPGFAADCLETLEEIALQYAEVFRAAGGESLRYVPALNDRPAHIDSLVRLIKRNLAGWDQADSGWDPVRDEAIRRAAAARAEAMRAASD